MTSTVFLRNKHRFVLCFFAAMLFSLIYTSCPFVNLGLGGMIDIEAPIIHVSRLVTFNDDGSASESVSSFETTIYTKKHVRFYGSAEDNDAVTGVCAQVKWLGDSDYSLLKYAELSGDSWTIDLEFQREGACWLKFVAEDEKANYTAKSAQIITLFVDNSAPSSESWYIDRKLNGIQYRLQNLETLKSLVADDPTLSDIRNMDVAQNGTFDICASFNDASGIKDITLSIWNEQGTQLCGGIRNSSDSVYAPRFVIDETIKNQFPGSGLHYLQIRYTASDVVTDPAPNEVTDQAVSLGWFIWWPEKDVPRFSISGMQNDRLSLYIKDSVNVTVFDDDGLKGTVQCTLTASGEQDRIFPATIQNQEREKNIIITVPDKPLEMKLRVTATDVNNNNLDKTIDVYVVDDSKPSLILTSPANNQIPGVSGADSSIIFSGVTLDKSGCSYLEFVWVPATFADKESIAREWVNKIAVSRTPVTASVQSQTGTGAYAGMKLWSAQLTSQGTESAFEKQAFNFTVPLSAFAAGLTEEKYFYIRLTRRDGVYIESELKLLADNIKPEIVPVYPAGNMSIIDQDSDLILKFKGVKENGVPMNTGSYRIEYIAPDGTATAVGGAMSGDSWQSDAIPKATLEQYALDKINPKYRYYAEDILGNSNEAVYQFVISSLPQIRTVTSTASSQCRKDDVIQIQATFSKAVSCTGDAYLKLTNISNDVTRLKKTDIVQASYKSGSGSTTLVFEYAVKEGDVCDGLQVYNEPGVGPIGGIDPAEVHMDTLKDSDNLQEKRKLTPITIDGIVPKVDDIVLTTTADVSNVKNGITYLKQGRTITATVTVSEQVTVQGAPTFVLYSGSNTDRNRLTLTWQSISADGKTLTFAKQVAAGDVNGALSYDKASCIGNLSVIKDRYGNDLVSTMTGVSDARITVDTVKQNPPRITIQGSKPDGKYTGVVTGTIADSATPAVKTAPEITEYSTDNGSSWTEYDTQLSLSSSAVLVARIRDVAGNVSNLTDPIVIEINNTFPAFTVECTNADGRYKSGQKLELKVYFEEPVSIAAAAAAYLDLGSGRTAGITAASKGAETVSEATFEYTVQATDDFTLRIVADGVHLTGITDLYGNAQGTAKLADPYERSGVICDSVAPSVDSMVPAGATTVTIGDETRTVYSNGTSITLTFTEPVSVATGKITLRQKTGWAIPPVLTAAEFNKVLNAVKAATIDTTKTNGLSGSQVLYLDGLEDWEMLFGAERSHPNDRYHGTGQYAGPYKKMSYGINADGTPDTSVKYVLDFDVDIWDSNNSTKTAFGKTFNDSRLNGETGIVKNRYSTTGHITGANGDMVTPTNIITTDTIRYVLEQAGFNSRTINVNSSYVTQVSDTTFTLQFPESLLGLAALEPGREWELIIEDGAFMDASGNAFAASETNEGEFISAGIATPVIRVDRYSYGLGIRQAKRDANGGITTEIIDVLKTSGTSELTTVPTAHVRTKIDCETKGVTIRYETVSKTGQDAATNHSEGRSGDSGDITVSWSATTFSDSFKIPTAVDTGKTKTSGEVFLMGTGTYTTSCRQYIVADAAYVATDSSKTTTSASLAKEGIFQTVLCITNPLFNDTNANSTNKRGNAGTGKQDLSIHGTTGTGGEPTIAPFPLRHMQNGSPFLRRTYQNGLDYYWISYEVLTDSCFGIYAGGKSPQDEKDGIKKGDYLYDWGRGNGIGVIKYGEFNKADGFKSWMAWPN